MSKFLVEKIVTIKVTTKAPREAQFEVKWSGYSDDRNTFEIADQFIDQKTGKVIQILVDYLNDHIVQIITEEVFDGITMYLVKWNNHPFSTFQKENHLDQTNAWEIYQKSKKEGSTSKKRRVVKSEQENLFCAYCGLPGPSLICPACKKVPLPAIHIYNEYLEAEDERIYEPAQTYERHGLPHDSFCGFHAIVCMFKKVFPDTEHTVSSVINDLYSFISDKSNTDIMNYESQKTLLKTALRSWDNRKSLSIRDYASEDTMRICADYLGVCIAVYINDVNPHQGSTWAVYFPGDCTYPRLIADLTGKTDCDGKVTFYIENLITNVGKHLHWNMLTPEKDGDDSWLAIAEDDFFLDQMNHLEIPRRDQIIHQTEEGPPVGFSTDSLFNWLFNSNTPTPMNPRTALPLFSEHAHIENALASGKYNFSTRQRHLLNVKFSKHALISPEQIQAIQNNWSLFYHIFRFTTLSYYLAGLVKNPEKIGFPFELSLTHILTANMEPMTLKKYQDLTMDSQEKLLNKISKLGTATRKVLMSIHNPYVNISLLDIAGFAGHEIEILKFLFLISRYQHEQNQPSQLLFPGLLFNLEQMIPASLRLRDPINRNYNLSFFPVFNQKNNCKFDEVLLFYYEHNPRFDMPRIHIEPFFSITNNIPMTMNDIPPAAQLEPFFGSYIRLSEDETFHDDLMAFAIATDAFLHEPQPLDTHTQATVEARRQAEAENRRRQHTRRASIVHFVFNYILHFWDIGWHNF